ncbi:MAG: hypothetical protein E7288_03775 [Lachnospiraceae bacterium]|nr:hypothetical protein [Lachnospiraceae bacterium]
MSGREERLLLVSKILKGEIGKKDVENELERISKQYGDECFNSYEVKKQPKPWTNNSLKELEVLSASGAASKEFYLYMAEVSEEVYSQKYKKKKLFRGVLFGVLAITVLIFIVCILRGNS